MSITVIEGISLDGVMQAPARPDEDTRGGFRHGGWGVPYSDEAVTAAWGERIARATAGGAFLLGRRTYLDFIEAWPKRRPGHQYTTTLTDTPKYVASTTLTEPLPWENSTLLTDPAQQLPGLKQEKDLVVMGSGALVRSLMQAGDLTSSCSPSPRWCSAKASACSRKTAPTLRSHWRRPSRPPTA